MDMHSWNPHFRSAGNSKCPLGKPRGVFRALRNIYDGNILRKELFPQKDPSNKSHVAVLSFVFSFVCFASIFSHFV